MLLTFQKNQAKCRILLIFLNFRDQIRSGDPDAFFVLNGDVCAEFPLREMLKFHQNAEEDVKATVLATEATKGMVCTFDPS